MKNTTDAALQMVADYRAGIKRPLSPGCIHLELRSTYSEDHEPRIPGPTAENPQLHTAIAAEWHGVKSGRDGVPYQLVTGLQDAALPAAIAALTYVLHQTGDVSSSLAVSIIIPMALIALAALAWPWLKK